MQCLPTPLAGLCTIEPEPIADERGFFARTYSSDAFAGWGLADRFVQSSVSYNAKAGTLRGMHFQREPHGEAKLVRCIRGAIHDVVVDLRPGSPTHGRWHAVHLDADNRRALYVPAMLAHGFLTLFDNTEVEYHMSTPFVADAASGVRHDDPAFAIDWPAPPRVISDRDRTWPPHRP